MATPEFKYQPMFEHGKDTTEYYLLTKDYVLSVMFHSCCAVLTTSRLLRF